MSELSQGVMKLVGEAVRGYSGSNVTAIGIASWGIIKNKEKLVRPTKKKEVNDCSFFLLFLLPANLNI